MQFKGYSNFTEGIKDPSVFDVPPECKHAKLTDLVCSMVTSLVPSRQMMSNNVVTKSMRRHDVVSTLI